MACRCPQSHVGYDERFGAQNDLGGELGLAHRAMKKSQQILFTLWRGLCRPHDEKSAFSPLLGRYSNTGASNTALSRGPASAFSLRAARKYQ
jgi:hypothetical protein